ncbi:MAG: enoyl-CoA hydratase/isomerase family protein [Mycobacteriaceae bacterium]
MPQLSRDGDVFVLDLSPGEEQSTGRDGGEITGRDGGENTENRFSPGWLTELDALLDEVEASSGPAALVTTGRGKFYSNGLDLDWLSEHLEETATYVGRTQALLARVLTMGMATVASLNGHTFAAGGMLALAHDVRVMRADRGFFCLPEVNIHIPFTPGMAALIQARLSPSAAHEAMTTGRRYGGTDALAAGIVDEAVGEDEVLARAVARAGALADKRGDTLAAIKTTMYSPALRALTDAVPTLGDGAGLGG